MRPRRRPPIAELRRALADAQARARAALQEAEDIAAMLPQPSTALGPAHRNRIRAVATKHIEALFGEALDMTTTLGPYWREHMERRMISAIEGAAAERTT